ncbi:MAG: HAMP domain-containing histidine kinase [Rhodospirillaceae bacterium]|nr:MAG: HAMP domain-containing histidine kinase [Rhodospirillaceae bacterium]
MVTRVFPGSGRLLRPTIIALLVISVVQVCWWMWDQANYARQNMERVHALYVDDAVAARRLAATGMSTEAIHVLFPHIEADGDGNLIIAPEAVTALEDGRQKHITQYIWESGFFLCVLAACIAILWRGLHEEREVRRQQDNFLAHVSHQFKTPLASLRLSVETLVKRQPPPEYAQQLAQRMLDDLSRLEGMVTKILDSARLNRGRVIFHNTRIELAAAVDNVVSRVMDMAQKHNVTLQAEVPAGLAIHADPLAVENVLRNLLENAIAATARTGGKVVVSAKSDRDGIDVLVKDNGTGFTAEDGRRLFEKFQRIETGDQVSSTGTGLGLFIVRRIMHFEHGRVSASSAGPGRGATFTVTWPQAIGDAVGDEGASA